MARRSSVPLNANSHLREAGRDRTLTAAGEGTSGRNLINKKKLSIDGTPARTITQFAIIISSGEDGDGEMACVF